MSDRYVVKVAELPPLSDDDKAISLAWARDSMWAAIADLFERSREESGLTYAALGKRIGRSRSQVQRWLSAPINMTASSAGLLAEGLDADLRVIVTPRTRKEPGTNRVSAADDALRFVEATLAPTPAVSAGSWIDEFSGAPQSVVAIPRMEPVLTAA